jgi:imidazolonepropionase-like amidohydrolase
MEAIIDEGHRHGLPVAGHVGPTDLVAHAVKAGVDVLVHSTVAPNGEIRTSEGEDLPALLKRFNVPVTTTVRLYDPNQVREDRRERIIRRIETMVGPSLKAQQAAGVALLFGTDFAGVGTPADPRQPILSEIHVLTLAGLSNAEVIQVITGNAAKHPMTPEDIGTIEPGKLADIIIVDDDPLTNIESITYPWVVIKGGQIVVDKR